MSVLDHLNAKADRQPSRHQATMAPGRIRRWTFEAQECRYASARHRREVCQHSCGVESPQLRKVASAKLASVDGTKPSAGRQCRVHAIAALAPRRSAAN